MLQENNMTELERLDKERHADFLNMLKGFVVNQVHSILLLLTVNLSSRKNCCNCLVCHFLFVVSPTLVAVCGC